MLVFIIIQTTEQHWTKLLHVNNEFKEDYHKQPTQPKFLHTVLYYISNLT